MKYVALTIAVACCNAMAVGTGEISLGWVEQPSCTGSNSSAKNVTHGAAAISAVIDSTPLDSEDKQAAVQACAFEARDFVGPQYIADDPVASTPLFREAFFRCIRSAPRGVEVFSVALRSESQCDGPASSRYTTCSPQDVTVNLNWCARDRGFNEGAICGQQAMSLARRDTRSNKVAPYLPIAGDIWTRSQMMGVAADLAKSGDVDAGFQMAICCQAHNKSAQRCLATNRDVVIQYLQKH